MAARGGGREGEMGEGNQKVNKKKKIKYSILLNNTEKYLTITQQFVIIFYRTRKLRQL